MPTAQVDAWAAVHQGSLADISALVDESLTDAAVARMMLHRRRAVVPEIIDEFFTRGGRDFMPYLANLAPQAALDFPGELAAAKAAGRVAESASHEAPPLLFERAMLSEMERRCADAQADLRLLLESYPGFVSAAFAAARLALADDDPVRAIEALACVERELAQTREGSALLADALRAVGMYEAASRYDLLALSNVGYADSRGNDCAPVDGTGRFVSDKRMLPAFYVGMLPGERMLYNDRGVYYVASSVLSGLLYAMFNNILGNAGDTRSGLQSSSSGSGVLEAVFAKLERMLNRGHPIAVTLRPLAATALRAWRRFAWLRRGADRALRRVLPRLAEWGLLQVPEHNRHSRLVQARVRSGIASIFGISAEALDLAFDRAHGARSREPELTIGESARAAPVEQADLALLNQSGALPPRAEEALHRLAILGGIAAG